MDEKTTTKGAVLVTGAASGMGRACVLKLDQAGYRVFAGVRKEQDAQDLKRIASERLTPIILEITNETSLANAVKTVTEAVGGDGLVGLVNNAGIAVPAPIELIPLADLRRQMEINVIAQVAVTQAFLPLLRKAKGRIINLGSVGGKITVPFAGALCASKYAMESINDALRMELYPWGIHVSLIAPGSIHTPAVEKLARDTEEMIRKFSPEGQKRYADTFRTFVDAFVRQEAAGSSPEVMAEAVLHALTAKVPRTRYPVGHRSRLLPLLARELPTRLLDQVRFRLFGLPRQFGGAQ
jgi:NAD(P)-dependent dehydrogenase (short-subunit alcohol dehydrogenase family)